MYVGLVGQKRIAMMTYATHKYPDHIHARYNAINLIDGIDGLASGLAAAALIIYGCAFFMIGRYVYAILSFSTLGVLVPFFYYNVFGDVKKRKKIFMGGKELSQSPPASSNTAQSICMINLAR